MVTRHIDVYGSREISLNLYFGSFFTVVSFQIPKSYSNYNSYIENQSSVGIKLYKTFVKTKMELPRESIRWCLHERHLQSMFALQYLQDRFCDVTLACKNGQTIRAHRTILCACSGYFDTVLADGSSGKDTLVIMKDCDYQDIQLLVQFMYYGEINVNEVSAND